MADQPAAWRQQITHVTTHVLASYAKAVRDGLPNAVAPRAMGVTAPSVAVARDGSLQKLPDEPTAHLGIERRSRGGNARTIRAQPQERTS